MLDKCLLDLAADIVDFIYRNLFCQDKLSVANLAPIFLTGPIFLIGFVAVHATYCRFLSLLRRKSSASQPLRHTLAQTTSQRSLHFIPADVFAILSQCRQPSVSRLSCDGREGSINLADCRHPILHLGHRDVSCFADVASVGFSCLLAASLAAA